LSLLVLSAGANASPWYLGAGGGEGEAEVIGHDRSQLVAESLAGNGQASLSAAGSEVDDTDSWKIYVGYRLNDWLAIEGSYQDLGETDGTFAATLDSPGNPITSGKLSSEYEAVALAAVAHWQAVEWLALQAKIGGHYWQHEYRLQGTNTHINDDDNGTGLLYGFGIRLGHWQHMALRLEWERFDNVEQEDGIDVKSLSLEWQF
jgi:opacity protein-like surface antigen